MDPNPQVRRNTFVIVAVVLFNLIWLTLLFLSCQSDAQLNSTPTATPMADIIDRSYGNLEKNCYFTATYERDAGQM